MKRIEFIAPVEAMRGNLSGAQDLRYAENDNKAYEGPVGSVNYARNYSPRFIGAKVAKNGRKYFTVRTKSANHLTAKAKHAMALLGGTGALVGAILHTKSSDVYEGVYAQWLAMQALGSKKTLRQYLSDTIRLGLEAKQKTITFAGPNAPVTIGNPWMTDPTPGAQVSSDVLLKFATELGPQGLVEIPILFTDANGNKHNLKVFAVTGQSWRDQQSTGGALDSMLGRVGYADGAVTGIRFVVPEGGDVKISVGSDLTSTPLYEKDDDVETAVASSDNPSTSSVYVAHPAA